MLIARIAAVVCVFIFISGTLAEADSPLDVVQQTFVNGAADSAIRSLQKSITANPSAADAHNLLCRVWYSEQRWDAAVTECERAVALTGNNSLYQLWLGRAYGEKADHSSWFTAIALAKKTHTCFERAVQLDPQNIEARSDLSEYYIEAPGFLGGGTDKAVSQANALETIDRATAFYVRARIAEHEKRNSDAEQQYKNALQLDKNSWRRWVDLASFYRRAGRLDDLEVAVKKAAELNTQNDSALVDSANLLLRTGRMLPLAAELVHRYIDKGMKSEDAPVFQAQYLLGQVLEKQGNMKAAKAAYQSAMTQASDFAPASSALKRLGA